jgi:CzcA family heavy metal efflux pump
MKNDAAPAKSGLLNSIIHFALRRRGAVTALAVLLLAYGLYTISGVSYDVFPEFASPQVSIRTEAPGLSAEQVEALVTRPIESVVLGATGISIEQSTSSQGLSAVKIVFSSKTNVYRARQIVAERLASLQGQLPREAQPPVLTPLTSSTGVVMVLGFTSKTRSLIDVRTIARWTVKPSLLAVPGVAGVQIFGQGVKQFQIQVDPDKLIRHRLGLNQVLSAARLATAVRGAGFIENPNQRITLQTGGQPVSAAGLSGVALFHRAGETLRLADVATVTTAQEPPVGAGLVNGRPGIVMLVNAQYGSNTLDVTNRVDRALQALKPALEREGIVFDSVFRPAYFIHTAVRNVLSALAIGAVLVIIVLFLFLFNFRTAAISCLAIPLSLMAGIIVMQYLGFSFNTMVLGGLAIALGEIVDDAVIDVENIHRRLRENRGLDTPRPVIRVILDASLEVRAAVVYATFAVIMVFFPILTLSGVAGRLFAPLGAAYILSVLASLLVALSVTPALCMLLLGSAQLTAEDPPVIRGLKKRYVRLLERVELRPRLVAFAVLLLLACALITAPFLKNSFMPSFEEGHYIVHMILVPGSSLKESLRLGKEVSTQLRKLPYVSIVAQKAGRPKNGSAIRGPNASEIEVNLKRGKQPLRAQAQIRSILKQIPGAAFSVNTFLKERMEETVSGYSASLVVNVFGNDLDVLDRVGRQASQVLKQTKGISGVQVLSQAGAPQVAITLRKAALLRWGIAPVAVLNAVETAYQGTTVGQIYHGERVFNVSVILPPADRGISSLGNLAVRTPAGVYLPLKQLAAIRMTSGRVAILHQGGRRVQTITANITGANGAAISAEVERRLRSLSLPSGVYLEFAGTAAAQSRAVKDLVFHALVAVVGIVLLVSLVAGNWRNTLLLLVNLPFALAGGVLAVMLTGGTMSLGSMVGFVTVFGITLRNSIMLLSHYQRLVLVDGMQWGPETALRGASERLSPILMTALVTALGLLPLALGVRAPGQEIVGALAIVVLGGIFTSTALNLLVLPTLALRFARLETPEEGK